MIRTAGTYGRLGRERRMGIASRPTCHPHSRGKCSQERRRVLCVVRWASAPVNSVLEGALLCSLYGRPLFCCCCLDLWKYKQSPRTFILRTNLKKILTCWRIRTTLLLSSLLKRVAFSCKEVPSVQSAGRSAITSDTVASVQT